MPVPGVVQLLRLTKNTGGEVWINPQQIIYAEIGKKKDAPPPDPKQKPAAKKGDEFMTILHMTGKEGKIFVSESPAEINRIIKSVKRQVRVDYQHL